MKKLMDILSQRERFSLMADGGSMLPLLQSGDLVYYRRIPYSRVVENDIVLVKKKNKLFTHRVIYKGEGYAVTRGDNNPYTDGNIKPGDIIARAMQLKRNGKIIVLDRIYELQSFLYIHEITRIMGALRKRGITTLILKGLPLHLHYEGRRPNRIYADCDILVSEKDAEKARSVLKKAGYRLFNNELSHTHRMLMDKKTEDSFVKKVGSFPVVFDIHYETVFMMTQVGKLDPLYPQSMINRMTDLFLENTKNVTIDGNRFPLLSEELLVPYLMLHFFHHNFKGTFRLTLIAEIIEKARRKDDFFPQMAAFINGYRLNGFAYPGFLLLAKYYRTSIPAPFLSSIMPPRPQMDYIRKHILPITPFEDASRVKSGILRFKQLFYLSIEPLWKKSIVFLYPAVLYSFWWVIKMKLRRYLRFPGGGKAAQS